MSIDVVEKRYSTYVVLPIRFFFKTSHNFLNSSFLKLNSTVTKRISVMNESLSKYCFHLFVIFCINTITISQSLQFNI